MQITVTEDTVGLILAALTDRAVASEHRTREALAKCQQEHEAVVRLLAQVDEKDAQIREMKKANQQKPGAK